MDLRVAVGERFVALLRSGAREREQTQTRAFRCECGRSGTVHHGVHVLCSDVKLDAVRLIIKSYVRALTCQHLINIIMHTRTMHLYSDSCTQCNGRLWAKANEDLAHAHGCGEHLANNVVDFGWLRIVCGL